METFCPISDQFSDQIASLLNPPPPLQVQVYFDELTATRQCDGLKVKPNGEYGKGVYAEKNFKEGDLILKDKMLVGAQHSSNKIDCLVCSYCFRFIGSIELQIGRKLYWRDLGVSTDECERKEFLHIERDCYNSDPSDEEDYSDAEDRKDIGGCSSSSSKSKISIPKDVIESLMNGDLRLPYSEEFPLPSTVSCPGGCKEAYYCSPSCAHADWEEFHSLLCTGKGSKALSTEALLKFIQHANETNDIFLPAAKVISFTILRYRKFKEDWLSGKGKYDTSGKCDFSFLLEAWKPVSMGYKKRWWDCIALPDDVHHSDEAAFRLQIKELANKSLQLLKAAIFDQECKPLFSLEIYGHIIGMFELNNLDLVVESPLENYFLHIDDLPSSEKREAEQITRPLLDALGDDYSICCQGTAFFPLQSCMNHSCEPNAKAFKREEDLDGQATIIALQPIQKGEEITISYIDEDLPVEERQASLADYGFRCRCRRCLEEEQSKA
ncbi:histone-lysine N-methyltransferase ATXR2 [Ipomoea triloba]|uniref:histone-lysine N-methyltransferase ATXR2 n=1 Tax=Ipomoea triloba TaxID=35885 RepID=UPI00125E6120|nr:histone-lysine N-methyltransferase ATXR2 [Ipomoea triloba]